MAEVSTLAAYAVRWLASQQYRLKRRTLESYAHVLKAHLLPALGRDTTLDALDDDRIRAALLAKREAGYSAGTVRLMFAVLRTMLTAARLDDRLPVCQPSARLARVFPRRKGPLPVHALRPAELARFLATALRLHPAMFPLFLVAARTGMRVGELLALRWRDVDLERRTLLVAFTRGWDGHEDTPKGGRSRAIGLSPEATEALVDLARLHDHPPATRHVFVGPSGAPWSRTHLRRTMHRFCTAAGLSARSVHALRYTFGTQLAEHRVSPLVIRDLLGHTSLTVTEQYLQGSADYLRVVDRLDGRRR